MPLPSSRCPRTPLHSPGETGALALWEPRSQPLPLGGSHAAHWVGGSLLLRGDPGQRSPKGFGPRARPLWGPVWTAGGFCLPASPSRRSLSEWRMQSIARDSDGSSDDEFFDAHGRLAAGAPWRPSREGCGGPKGLEGWGLMGRLLCKVLGEQHGREGKTEVVTPSRRLTPPGCRDARGAGRRGPSSGTPP